MMRNLSVAVVAAAILLGAAAPAPAAATDIGMKTQLKPFNVTIRVFDPSKGLESGQDYVLPVDSPDAEHAIASTTANAASFITKTEAGRPLPVAFTCVKIEPR